LEDPVRGAFIDYVDENLRRDNPLGLSNRCMILLFEGENAFRHLMDDVVGRASPRVTGHTVRGTYGDFIRDANGRIRHFEPAVITGPTPELSVEHLRLLAQYSESDGGILTGRCKYPPGSNIETCLIIIKPDNFEKPTRRPGNIIDVFSRTGLRIVGTKLFGMTVAQAEDFYGPLKSLFLTRLKPNLTQETYARLHNAFAFPFNMADAERIADMLAERNAVAELNRIVEYMTGVNPEEVPDPKQKAAASRSKCLVMLYEGDNAISRIRRYLGSTDPTKAEPATVRSEYGRDLMRNGAHASDTVASSKRERKIIGMWEEKPESDFKKVIELAKSPELTKMAQSRLEELEK